MIGCAISLGVDKPVERQMRNLNAEADEIKEVFDGECYDCASLRSRFGRWQIRACECLNSAIQQTTWGVRTDLENIRREFEEEMPPDLCVEGIEEHWGHFFEGKRLRLKTATRLISEYPEQSA